MWKMFFVVGVLGGLSISRGATFNPSDYPITNVRPHGQVGDMSPHAQVFTLENRTDSFAQVQVMITEGQSTQYRTVAVAAHSHSDFTYTPALEGSDYSAVPVNAIQTPVRQIHVNVIQPPKLPTGLLDQFGHMDPTFFELGFQDSGTGSGMTARVASHCSTEALVTISSGSNQLSVDVSAAKPEDGKGESTEANGEGLAFSPDENLFRYAIISVTQVVTDSFGNKQPQRNDIQLEDLKVAPSSGHIVGKIKNTGPFPAYVELGFLTEAPSGSLIPPSRVHQWIGPIAPYSDTEIDRQLDQDFIHPDDPANPPLNSPAFPYIFYMGCSSFIPSGNKSTIPQISG